MTPHKYTKEEHDFIVKNAPGIGNQDLTDRFNEYFGLDLTVSQIKSHKHNYRITSGLNGQFTKGNVPINKGTKGMFNIGGNKTSFKKGQQPMNYKPVGTERVDRDGYVLVKVQDDGPWHKRWRSKHRVLWEKEHGKIPKGHRLIFLDGNRQNVSLDNLSLVTFGQSAVMSQRGLYSNNPEATKAGILVADLIMKTTERSNQ